MSQLNLFDREGDVETLDLESHGELKVYRGWLPSEGANLLFRQLYELPHWEQPEIQLYGKKHLTPRKQIWFGDPGAVMTYSGARFEPVMWPDFLTTLRGALEQFMALKFNSALANLYRDGSDSVGWHADDEKELGPAPTIASLSLGGERVFKLKPKTSGVSMTAGVRNISLQSGDLLLMMGATQRYWLHSIAKTTKRCDSRINLTFRRIFAAT